MWIIVWTVQLVLWDTALCEPQPCNDEYKFPCKKGGCTKMSWVCDKDDDCGDRSDQDVCGPHCPKFSYRCANGFGCYSYLKHCDAVLDCSDGTDEFSCKGCLIGYTKCLNGHCSAKRDLCCPVRSGACAVSDVDDLLETMKGDLIYANGRDLYSLSLLNNTKRLLHRQGGFEITALTYRAETNTIFWTAGSKIWSLSLTANEDQAQLFGEIRAACSIVHMAYDWITGNFYLVCRHSRVLVCGLRSGQTLMRCSKLISVDMNNITWLAVDPNFGRMFIGGSVSSGFQLVEAESDGSNARKIYEGDLKARLYFDSKINDILILKADDTGYLGGFNVADRTARSITSKFIEVNSTAKALFTNIAILRRLDEVYGVFFAQNRTLTQWKTLGIEPTTQLFYLADPTAQPLGENPCDQLQCDHLCLLAHGGAVCKCASVYADETRPCQLRSNGKEAAQIHPQSSEATHATANGGHLKSRSDHLVHAMYIVMMAVSVTCGAVLCYYLLSRKKYYKAQVSLNRAEPMATFDNKGSSLLLAGESRRSSYVALQTPMRAGALYRAES